MQPLTQIDHKICNGRGVLAFAQLVYLSDARRPSHASMNSTAQHFFQEALRAVSACTISLSKTPLPQSKELKLGSSAEPIKLQRPLSTLPQHSPIRCSSFHAKYTFEETHMSSLKGAVKLSALLHEPCALDLASIHTGGNSIAFSQPEESMQPVHQIVFSHKLPYYVTSSHELTKHVHIPADKLLLEAYLKSLS